MSPEGEEIKPNVEVLEIPRDAKGRIRWAVLRKQPEEILVSAIENEVIKLMNMGITITSEGLRSVKQAGLVFGITQYYPGGITQLQRNVGSEVVNKPKNYWTPEIIEEVAGNLLAQGIQLNSQSLRATGYSTFETTANRNYPGRMRALKAQLGVESGKKQNGYWKDPKTIENETANYINQGGKLTLDELKKAGKTALWGAIAKNYPGGLLGLREKLQLESYKRPDGYWTPEHIEQEAEAFIQKEGSLSFTLLEQEGMSSFYAAIRLHYPGGMKKLTEKFGVVMRRSPNNPWTAEDIEQEVKRFVEEHGDVSYNLLDQQGRGDLHHAIPRIYPGGIRKLREALGMGRNRRPTNFWTPEKIEAEALEVYKAIGELSYAGLRGLRRNDLGVSIPRKYPGGMIGLRQKLGISQSAQEEIVSPDEANEQLRKLLEEQ